MDPRQTYLRILILAAVLCGLWQFGSTFNLDLDTKIVYRMRSRGQWFGFSVALHKQKNNGWILVGAPKAQTNQDNVIEGGTVYKCSPNGPNTCRPVPFDLKGSAYRIENGKREDINNKSNQWFGATVSSGGPDLPVVACAPRFIHFSKGRIQPAGTCYVAHPDLNRFDEYTPCKSQWGYHRQGWCQAGMSAAISKKGERIYIGATGSWHWQGQIFSQNLLFDSKAIGLKEGPGSLDVTYLGFSTTVGEFSNDNLDDVVVGRPRGANLTGEVLVFDFLLDKLHNFSGEQIGSYFGYSVAVADINGDKLDDIIVGAPFYNDFDAKDDSYESGRVHFLYQNRDGFTRDKIDGKHSKGRFGLSLSSLGDINRDGYSDIVIGAPYEGDNGQGAVYVFQGSQNGILKNPSQVIYAKDIGSNVRTFGFSVSGGVDLDSNGYNDLLVGSYSSDTAVYFRAKPIITITTEISVSPKQIHLEDKLCKLRDKTPVSCLTITVCFNSSGSSDYRNIYASYEMVLDEKSSDKRLFFLEETESEKETKIDVSILLDKEKLYCDKKQVYVTNSIYDKLSPITVKVEPSLTTNRRGKRQALFLPPMIDQNVESTVRKEIAIKKKCGTDQVCIPDIQMKVTHNLKKYEFSSKGRKKKISFTVEIINKAESAFDARFYFNMSDLVFFDKVEGKRKTDCQIPFGDSTLMECFLGNPFKRMESMKLEITMTPKEITRKASDFEFRFSANSTNPERNTTIEDNEHIITIPVQVDANLTVDGFSYPQIIGYNVSTYNKIKKQVYDSDLGPEIVHAYEITNHGESNIRKAEVIILWPSTTLSGQPILYITRPPITSKNVVCRRIIVDPLQLKLQLVRSQLEKIVFPVELEEIQRDEGGRSHRTAREVKRFNGTAYESEMECDNALCIIIHCTITNLRADNEALIAVAGRLWVSTVTDLGLSRVGVQSKIIARVLELPYQVNPAYLGYEYKEIATEIDSIEEPPARQPIPWWIIAVALCVGVIILIVIIIILWKCGFFQRKKYVEGRSGKYDKNGYHSPQSDDAYL